MDERLHTTGNAAYLIEKKAREEEKESNAIKNVKLGQAGNLKTTEARTKVDVEVYRKSAEEKQKLKDLKKMAKRGY